MKNITHIIYSNGISGHEKAIIGMLNENNELFNHKLIFLTKNNNLKNEIIAKNIDLKNVEIFKIKNLLLDFYRIFLYIKASNSDLIHSHLVHADLIISFLKIVGFIKVPIVTTRPYQYNINNFSILKNIIIYKYLCNFNIEICISKEIEDLLIKYEKKNKTQVIYYGIPITKNNSEKNNDSLDIVIVGRLLQWKGHLNFLINYSKIKVKLEKKYKHKIFIFGDGPEKNNILKTIKKYNLDNIFLMGEENDTSNIFNGKSILIHSSKFEGFGIVILEAFQHKIAVISSKYGAMKEAIKNNITGRLYDINDNNSFEDAFYYTIENLESIQEAGFKSYKEYFNSKRMLDDYNNLYQKLI